MNVIVHGEIYSLDGFFYNIFSSEADCKYLGTLTKENDFFTNGLGIIFVISTSKPLSDMKEGNIQLLLISYKLDSADKIYDITRIDATENNINLVKDLLKDCKTDRKIDTYPDNTSFQDLEKILNLADAILYD